MFRMCRLHPRRQPPAPLPSSPAPTASDPATSYPHLASPSPSPPPSPPLPPPDTAKSYPHLPPAPLQPSLLRRGSLPVPKLAPLDFAVLPSPCAPPSHPTTPRRQIHAISTSLSRLRPYLYISSELPARDLPTLSRARVTHVVNLAGRHAPNHHPDSLAYLRLHLPDHPSAAAHLQAALLPILAFIHRARRARSAALVHCTQGISRSVTAAAAYLMVYEGLSLDHAIRDIRSSRPIANPNTGFWDMLRRLERSLRHGLPADRLLLVCPHAEHLADPEAPYVALPLEAGHVLQDHRVYILHRRERKGLLVAHGPQADDQLKLVAIKIARKIADQEKADAQRHGGPRAQNPVGVVRLGDDAKMDAELGRALREG